MGLALPLDFFLPPPTFFISNQVFLAFDDDLVVVPKVFLIWDVDNVGATLKPKEQLLVSASSITAPSATEFKKLLVHLQQGHVAGLVTADVNVMETVLNF